MGYQPHYIASFEDDSGQFTYYEPFLIPEKAFPVLQDAWCYRGTVIRKQGYSLLGRLQRDLSKQDAGNVVVPAGPYPVTYTSNLFTMLGLLSTEPNAQLVPGSATTPIILSIAGPISATLTDVTGTGTFVVTPGDTVIDSASVNYSTGVITLVFNATAADSDMIVDASYYPGLPVMGLETQETNVINEELMIAFDTKYAYKYSYGTLRFVELVPGTTWSGDESNLFWSCNYSTNGNGKLFWASNDFMPIDPLRYYDTVTWTTFAPAIDGVNTLFNAAAFLPFKGRFLMINTWEGLTVTGISTAKNYPQRIRWSALGSPLAATAFRSDKVGLGGFLDLPTSEVIVSAEFLKDVLLIKCEGSSWRVIDTGDASWPFVFQKINTELGSESKFSLVPFDSGVYSVSNYGITTDDTINVTRIDLQIPQTVFKFNNDKSGIEKVCGIRDYYNEVVYWCYGDCSNTPLYPNRILMYNYRNETYATFADSFTRFGYFQDINDKSWANLPYTSWGGWNTAWNAPLLQSYFPSVIAGTQHGFVETLMAQLVNDASLYISEIVFGPQVIFKIPQHNLVNGDVVYISGVIGSSPSGINPSKLNGNTFLVSKKDDDHVILSPWFTPLPPPTPPPPPYFTDVYTAKLADPTSVYLGGGVVAKWNNFIITTKRFSPFYEAGTQCRLGYVDHFLTKTSSGQVIGNVFVNENSSTSMTDQPAAQMGTNIVNTCPENLTLVPFQASQDKIWHRQWVDSVCQNFQITLTLSPEQIATRATYEQDFQLHAMSFYLSPNARMTQ